MPTPYHVKISPAAQRQIFALPVKQQKNIIKFLEGLAINPRPPGAKKVDGMSGLYCEDLTYLRMIYKVEDQEILILLIKSV